MIKTFTARIASSLFAALNRVAAADAAYRQADRLRHLSDDHLADMGLSRRDAEALLDAPHSGSGTPNRARAVQLRRA
jgi:uncharacterized protein YjiS (DUF1127 family)